MPNSVGAIAEPSSGARNEWTCSSSATSVLPTLWKVAAARIRIEALIRSANISAMVESTVARVIASRRSATLSPISAGLHHAGMQVEIVRHHGRAEDAERDVEHVRVGDDLRGRRKAADHRAPVRIRHRDLHREAHRDDAEQRDDERFDPAEAEILQPQNEEHVERGDQHADLERNAEQQIEPDRGADHLGKVGGADRDLRQHPERPRHRARKRVAARLRQVAAGADAEPRAQRLQQDRHQVREQRDGEQRVAELGAAGERGRPVAGIHVADRHQVAGPEERHQLAPERSGRPGGDGAEHLGERRPLRACPPAALGCGVLRGRGRQHRAANPQRFPRKPN